MLLSLFATLILGPRSESDAMYGRLIESPSGAIEAQTATDRFVSKGKPDIWLVGTVHLGERSYYRSLQKILNGRELVLFEGVKPEPAIVVGGGAYGRSEPGGVYALLAKATGLMSQDEGIDTTNPYWQDWDLSWPELDRLNKEVEARKGKSTGYGRIHPLLDLSSVEAKILMGALAAPTPGVAEALKLLLARTVASPPSGSDLDEMVLKARNKPVLDVLGVQIGVSHPLRSVAVFYGIDHMSEFRSVLVQRYGYRLGERRWFTVVRADRKKVDADGQRLLDLTNRDSASGGATPSSKQSGADRTPSKIGP